MSGKDRYKEVQESENDEDGIQKDLDGLKSNTEREDTEETGDIENNDGENEYYSFDEMSSILLDIRKDIKKLNRMDGYLCIPDRIFTLIIKSKLKPNEKNVLGYICKRTLGFYKVSSIVDGKDISEFTLIPMKKIYPIMKSLKNKDIINYDENRKNVITINLEIREWTDTDKSGENPFGKGICDFINLKRVSKTKTQGNKKIKKLDETHKKKDSE